MYQVLLVGLGGHGVEVAKNIVLAGIHSLDLWDVHQLHYNDLATNFAVQDTESNGKIEMEEEDEGGNVDVELRIYTYMYDE